MFVGEAIGLMRDILPAGEILARVTEEAETRCCAGVPAHALRNANGNITCLWQ